MLKPYPLALCALTGWLLVAAAAASAQGGTAAPGLPPPTEALPPDALPGAAPSPSVAVQIGVRLGYSHYTLSGAEADLRAANSTFEPGQFACAGLVVRGRVAGPLALQGEMLYLRRGGRYAQPFFGDSEPFEEHSLQVPLLLSLQLVRIGPLGLRAEGGYAAHLALSGPVINQAAYPAGTRFEDKGVTFGPAVGGELNYRLGSVQYFLHARYTWENTDFFIRSYGGQSYALRNQGFIITTGVLLGTTKLE